MFDVCWRVAIIYYVLEVSLFSCALNFVALVLYIIQSTKNLESKSPKENHDVWRIKTNVKVLWPPELEHVKGFTVKDKVVLALKSLKIILAKKPEENSYFSKWADAVEPAVATP